MKPNNIIYQKIPEDKFFRVWMEFLSPFHRLTAREKDVAARVIAQYFRLKETVQDPVLMKEVLWSHSSRKDMRESLGMTQAHFQMVLMKLKAAHVIVEDGNLNERFIPHMSDDPRFMLSIIFDWSSPSNPAKSGEQG